MSSTSDRARPVRLAYEEGFEDMKLPMLAAGAATEMIHGLFT